MENLDEQIRNYSRGSIITNETIFEDLVSFKNEEELTTEFVKTWVVPFYMNIEQTNHEWLELLQDVNDRMSREIVLKLLGDFNWRTRQTGAFFAIINNYTDLVDIIGIHFLKSEVCYAGRIYAYMLAYLNNEKSIKYLDDYLTYYLSKYELWYDQREAMEALTYIDKVNKSNLTEKHKDNWLKFIENKPHWEKDIQFDNLEKYVEFINKVVVR